MHTVTQSFTTPSRRFSAGHTVSEADLDGPLTLADWERLGYVAPPVPAGDAVPPDAVGAADPVTDAPVDDEMAITG